MSWPTPSSGQGKDPHGRRGANEAAARPSGYHASADDDPDHGPIRGHDHHGQPGAALLTHRHSSGIEITDIQVRLVDNERLRAWATITFNGAFVIKGIRVIQGNRRLFVAMPSKQQKDGKYQDIAHPITPDFRDFLEQCILEMHAEIEAAGGARAARAPADLADF
jgi:stage V sporulation protein G